MKQNLHPKWAFGLAIVLVLCFATGAVFFPVVIVTDRTDFILFGDYGPYTQASTDFYSAVKPDLIQFLKNQGFTEKSNPKWRLNSSVEELHLQNSKEPYITLSKSYPDLTEVNIFVQPPSEFYDNSQDPAGIEVRYIYRYLQFYHDKPRFLDRNPTEMWELSKKMSLWWAARCKQHPRPFTGGGSSGPAFTPNTPAQSTGSEATPALP